MKQCPNCHAFLSSRMSTCPKCRVATIDDWATGIENAPEAWVRTRTRKHTRESLQALQRSKIAAPTVDVSDRIDDFVPTTEVDPARRGRFGRKDDETVEVRPEQLGDWVSEALSLGDTSSTAWLKKTANYETGFPGKPSVPTPQMLPSVPRELKEMREAVKVRTLTRNEPNPLADLDIDFDDDDFDLDYSLDFDLNLDEDLLAIEEWSLAGLAPSTGAADAPHSVAEEKEEEEEIELLDIVELVPFAEIEKEAVDEVAQAAEVDAVLELDDILEFVEEEVLADPPSVSADDLVISEVLLLDEKLAKPEPVAPTRKRLGTREAWAPLSAEQLRNELLNRLDISAEEDWSHVAPRARDHSYRIEDLPDPYDDVEPMWMFEDPLLEKSFGSVASHVEIVQGPSITVTPQGRQRTAAQWLGRAAGATFFFSSGVAAGSNAALLPVIVVAAMAGVCSLVAAGRRARVWTVLVVGSVTGAFASWMNHLGVLRGVLSPQTLGVWESAAVGGVVLALMWLLASVVEASAD